MSLDGWFEFVRLESSLVEDPRVRSQVACVIERFAVESGVTLDRSTLRAMGFALASWQVVRLSLPPTSDVEGLAMLADYIVRRHDEES